MKEFVLVEFLFTLDEYYKELRKLTALGDDFRLIKCHDEWEGDDDGNHFDYKRASEEINSMSA